MRPTTDTSMGEPIAERFEHRRRLHEQVSHLRAL